MVNLNTSKTDEARRTQLNTLVPFVRSVVSLQNSFVVVSQWLGTT